MQHLLMGFSSISPNQPKATHKVEVSHPYLFDYLECERRWRSLLTWNECLDLSLLLSLGQSPVVPRVTWEGYEELKNVRLEKPRKCPTSLEPACYKVVTFLMVGYAPIVFGP